MGVTYHFGYPNMQRIVAIDEAVNNAQNGEKYQVNYRGKYRPLTVIEVPIEMLVYRIENIRTKSLQKEWLAQHRDLPRDLFVSDPNSIEAQENQHQVLKKLVDKENLLKTFKDNSLDNRKSRIITCVVVAFLPCKSVVFSTPFLRHWRMDPQ